MTSKVYTDAINALNSLQTNFATIEAIRKAGGKSNQDAIPQMVEWARRAGYETKDFDRLNIIHVTGTKGKGSTCAFVQSILSQYQPQIINKIGLYTSPHLKSVRERIRINGEPLSEKLFVKYFFEVWDKLESTSSDLDRFPDMGPGVKPGYFRYLTLLSFHVFLQENVDTAIYEVGIGGEYDSTNIIESPTVCGVSSLGIDHTNILGTTIQQIAWNKGGIFKPNVPALTVIQPPEAILVLKERAMERHTDLQVVRTPSQIEDDIIKLGLPAGFQKINASLAVHLASVHLERLGAKDVSIIKDNLPEKFVKGLEQASWPGRCQTIDRGAVQWAIDGAHTKESISEAGKWFSTRVNKNAKHHVLLFNQQTRDANALLTVLVESIKGSIVFDHVIFTTNVTWSSGDYSPDLNSLNTSSEDVSNLVVQRALAQVWKTIDNVAQCHIYATIEDSVKFIEELGGQTQVFVTGSLHLVGGLLVVFDGSSSE